MITIVISSYRYGHLAAHCIESILTQSTKPEKILFVDDGCGDCFHLKQIYPEIEFIFRETNLGTVSNFQDMLEKVSTEYCMFIGADNWLRSDAIELAQKIIDLEQPDIVTYDMVLTGEKKQTRVSHHKNEIERYQGDYYWTKKNSHHGSMIYRTALAKQVGGYSKIEHNFVHTCEDWSLWNKMTAAGAKVAYINEALLYYRHHRENFNSY
jgi:glycosyltransferase involved in cell wall biosynthesis